MATAIIKKLDIDITKIIVNQKQGYLNTYYKRLNIKHKRKKINDINYNTAKSDLIFYKSFDNHDNDFHYEFIYRSPEGHYFKRLFTPVEEVFSLVSEKYVLNKYNENKSLF